jgi:hypothetical protein
MQLLLVTDVDQGIELGEQILDELDPKMEIRDLSELKWLLGTSYTARANDVQDCKKAIRLLHEAR